MSGGGYNSSIAHRDRLLIIPHRALGFSRTAAVLRRVAMTLCSAQGRPGLGERVERTTLQQRSGGRLVALSTHDHGEHGVDELMRRSKTAWPSSAMHPTLVREPFPGVGLRGEV